MELILDIFWEKQKAYIEWKQVACAVILALLLAGMYKYAAGQRALAEKYLEQAALPVSLTVTEPLVSIPVLPEEEMIFLQGSVFQRSEEQQQEEKDKAYPAAAGTGEENGHPHITAGKQNYGVSYGGTGDTEDGSGTKAEDAGNNIKAAANSEKAAGNSTKATENSTKATKNTAVQKADQSIGEAQKTVTAIPGIDTVTGSAGILSGREEEGGKETEDEKTDADAKTETAAGGVWGNPAAGIERFPGFLADAQGHIIGYTDAAKIMKDNLLVLPVHQACTGIEKNALKGLEAEILEIYIPTNIIYIAPGAFDGMTNLYYIEAEDGNSAFYSKDGILYHKNGKVAAWPGRLK